MTSPFSIKFQGFGDQKQESTKQMLKRSFEQVFTRNSNLKPDEAYYLQASKLHLQCVKTQREITQVASQIKELKFLTTFKYGQGRASNQTHKKNQKSEQRSSENKRRNRRTAVQIARHYICQIKMCGKSYGSEGSLNQHIKLKHQSIV